MIVFLGGTCNESEWREELISKLKDVDYFNPVVENWNEEAQRNERVQRKESDYNLYVLTPKITGVYAIAEVVEDSCKKPEKTLFCYLKEDNGLVFTKSQIYSLDQVSKMIKRNGGSVFNNLQEIADFLNKKA